MNPFEVLGVPNNCSLEKAKEGFRRLAMKYHPDRVSEAEKNAAAEKFKAINAALSLIEGGFKYEPAKKDPTSASPQSYARPKTTTNFYASQETYSGVNTDEEPTIIAYRQQAGNDYEAFVPIRTAAQGFVLETTINNTRYKIRIPPGVPNGTTILVGPTQREVNVLITFRSQTIKTIKNTEAEVVIKNGDEILQSGRQIAEITLTSEQHSRGITIYLDVWTGGKVKVVVPKYHNIQQPITIPSAGYFNWNRTKKKAADLNNLYVFVKIKDPAFVQSKVMF